MMKKICLFTSDVKYYSTERFTQEAQKNDIDFNVHSYNNVVIDLNNQKPDIHVDGHSIQTHSHFIFRNSMGLKDIQKTIAGFVSDKIILNKRTLSNSSVSTKLYRTMVLIKSGLPVISSITAASDENFITLAREALATYKKIIIKPVDGTHGKGISLITSETELLAWKKDKEYSTYLIQEYIESNSDVRILVLGNKVLGGMKRVKKDGEFRANISQGAHAEIFAVSPELERMAISATECLDFDFAGVDILFDKNNKPYIIEVNSAPQFEGFEKTTGVNVAGAILDFLCTQ